MKQKARDHVQRLEYAFGIGGGCLEGWHLDLPIVQHEIHVFHRRGIGNVPLVVLHHVRDVIQVQIQRLQVVFKVFEGLDIFLHFLVLRICHEHDAIDPAKHDLPGGVVDDLAQER